MTEKLLLAFYIMMEADVVNEKIQKICYYCFRLLKKWATTLWKIRHVTKIRKMLHQKAH